MLPPLIGLAGYAGVGKDTVAELLKELVQAIPFSFSDPLYPEVAKAYGVDIEWMKDRAIKDSPQEEMILARCNDERFADIAAHAAMGAEVGWTISLTRYAEELRKPRTPRQVLQWWGAEYRRKQDPAYWLKKAQAAIDGYWRGGSGGEKMLVNTSVRFPNEIGFIKSNGGQVWLVKRDIERPNGHVAEAGIDPSEASLHIDNTSTIDDLRRKLVAALGVA